jgi:hypothetical protein
VSPKIGKKKNNTNPISFIADMPLNKVRLMWDWRHGSTGKTSS